MTKAEELRSTKETCRSCESELRPQGAFLDALFDITADIVFCKNTDGRYLICNRGFAELVGRDSSEIIGRTDFDIYPLSVAEEHRRNDQLVLACKERQGMREWISYPDGNRIPVETLKAPYYGNDGKLMGIIGVSRNITESVKIEDQLKESKRKFQKLYENIVDGLAAVDMEGNIIGFNSAFQKLIGYPSEEIYTLRYEDITPVKWHSLERKILKEQVTERRYSGIYEKEYTRKDGSVFPVELITYLIQNDAGAPSGFWAIIRDISVRKRSEEVIKESRQQLSDIIEFLPDATFVIDQEGKVIAWNRAIEEMTGIKASDMMGKGNYEYALPFYGDRRPILVDLVPRSKEEIESIYANIKYTNLEKEEFSIEGEAYMPAFRGSEAYLYGKAGVLRDSAGKIIGAIESIRDITARCKAERKYKAIVENAIMGIYQATPGGHIINANPAFAHILGYESPEVAINTITDMAQQLYVNPEERAELMRQMKDNGVVEGQEIYFSRKDGSKGWLIFNGRAARDNRGQIIYYEGAIQDISERKNLEMQLRQSQKMEAIGTLAGGIAHDFNNILTAVIGYTEMALNEPETTALLRRYLKQIHRAGIQASSLVKQILAFSRQSDDKLSPLNVSPIIKETLKLLKATLPATIEIQQKIGAAYPYMVNANPTHIHQIVMNLCTNAAHAMGGKGTLKIGLKSVDIRPEDVHIAAGLKTRKYLKLTVSDTGHGIIVEIRDKIFDPFFTTKKPGEGTGMGLSVVHGIVKSYDGAIAVKSEAGKGTEFEVYIPLLIEETVEISHDPDLKVVFGKERILFVDDKKELVDLGDMMLTGLGYEVEGRTSSLEALELFRAKPDRFDLVITDMTMPNMTGLELAQELIRIRPNIPIILCTGFSEHVTPDTVCNWGLKEVIMKPIVRSQISASIRRVLESD